MQRYNPRTHVFDHSGRMPKLKRERDTLDKFCRRMQTCYQAKYTAIPISDALHQKIVLKVGGETVDGVLHTPKGLVAVELLGYSPLKDRGDVMARDVDLCRRIKVDLYDHLREKCVSLSLGYGERRRPGPAYATFRTVPVYRNFNQAVDELRSILAIVCMPKVKEFLSVRFLKPTAMERRKRAGTVYLDENRFPICSAHFERVRFHGLNENSIPQVDGNLSGGFIGLDEKWIQERVEKKIHTSLTLNRERANGLPLWLIVHSDGHPIHRTIDDGDRPRAIELCRDVLNSTKHGFSRAYWADQTAFLDAGWVGRIM